MKKRGFTLAEVLITLAIIGVVAAISIPSVISNTQQQEFKTGLRKAVSVLNSAITMNVAMDGMSPYDIMDPNYRLWDYLSSHMSVMQPATRLYKMYYVHPGSFYTGPESGAYSDNWVFYTTDGMRFEFNGGGSGVGTNYSRYVLYETGQPLNIVQYTNWDCDQRNQRNIEGGEYYPCQCGSFGLNNNPDGTQAPPCLITVDVNGDRKPNPANVNCKNVNCAKPYKYSDAVGTKLSDIFSIMITDKQAIPYGVAAQRAMYQAQAKK